VEEEKGIGGGSEEEAGEEEIGREGDEGEIFQSSKKTVRSLAGIVEGRKMEMMGSIKR